MVDGDGPVRVPAGCALLPAQPAVANPALGSVCGLRVMVVLDASASIDAAAVRTVASALVDALDGTGSSMAIVEFSTDAGVQVGYTVVDESSRVFSTARWPGSATGGSSNLEAGLAAAVAASPDLTVVVTDGVANASSGAGGHGGHPIVAVQDEAVHFAVAHADQLKAAGSRVFAVGVGNADTSMLAAISGPSAGGDVASADYSVGGADAIAASLHTVASAGCPTPTSEEPGEFAVAQAVGGFCNTSPITVPATGTSGVAAPYPSTITVSGADPVAGLVTVQLAGVGHTTPIDFDILLVGPTGANIVLLSDAGGLAGVTGVEPDVRRQRTCRRHAARHRHVPPDEPGCRQRFVAGAGAATVGRDDVGDVHQHRPEWGVEPVRRRRRGRRRRHDRRRLVPDRVQRRRHRGDDGDGGDVGPEPVAGR